MRHSSQKKKMGPGRSQACFPLARCTGQQCPLTLSASVSRPVGHVHTHPRNLDSPTAVSKFHPVLGKSLHWGRLRTLASSGSWPKVMGEGKIAMPIGLLSSTDEKQQGAARMNQATYFLVCTLSVPNTQE